MRVEDSPDKKRIPRKRKTSSVSSRLKMIESNEQSIEEKSIRLRLLYDNEGNGDERRFTNLTKSVFSVLLSGKENNEENENNTKKIVNMIEGLELSSSKFVACSYIAEADSLHYKQLNEQILKKIDEIHGMEDSNLRALENARSGQRIRDEYTAHLETLNKFESENKIDDRINELMSKRVKLEQKLKSYTDLLDSYKHDYHMFVQSITNIQNSQKNASNLL